MKIIRLTAENIKKISAVDITPNSNLVQITGRNGQGKSSILDAIWFALGGTKDHPTQPIRQGAESGSIMLDLGDYVVTRRFNEKGTTLTVKSKEGASFPSPQAMLDKMLGDMSFDPLEFSRTKPKDQYEKLRGIAGIGGQLEDLEYQEKGLFEERTEVNRNTKSLESQAQGIIVAADVPDEPVDVSALVAEGEKKRNENNRIEQAGKAVTAFEQSMSDINAEIGRLDERIFELRNQFKHYEEQKAIAEKIAKLPLVDLTDLRTQVADASATNKMVGDKQRKNGILKELKVAQTKATDLTTKIEAKRKEIIALLEGAKMPVQGLTLAEGQIYFNNVPFNQASTAEQLKVSVAIAMAANPSLRVIRIKDGSLLDDGNMAILTSMATENDYQIWVERVDGSGEVGIVMEDGHVKADNQEQQAA